MAQSYFHEKFNTSIVTALLFTNLSLCEKERKLQKFVNDNEERYEIFCDNIHHLLINKDVTASAQTLYLTIDGFSFISDSIAEQQNGCVPVLTINKYSPCCPDISAYIDVALSFFSSCTSLVKDTALSYEKTA